MSIIIAGVQHRCICPHNVPVPPVAYGQDPARYRTLAHRVKFAAKFTMSVVSGAECSLRDETSFLGEQVRESWSSYVRESAEPVRSSDLAVALQAILAHVGDNYGTL